MESSQETTSRELKDVAHDSAQRQLSELFGSYRAEWLREQIFDLYTSPVYFPELTTNRSCVLIGGRGTGKTTALRALSWEGQQRLSSEHPSQWPYYGVYYRSDTNRVNAFRGPEIHPDRWNVLFAHYFNLLLSERLLAFTSWYEVDAAHETVLTARSCADIATSLGIESAPQSTAVLSVLLRSARLGFETYINNVADQPSPPLSLQGAPLALVVEELASYKPFADKLFFIIIDEYENFLDEQQRVVNTLLKHAGSQLSFKIGVRELGFRQRTTLNEHEQLRSPADYVRIDISQKLEGVFPDFAARVCDERISRLAGPAAEGSLGVRELFPSLSEDDEARLLGVESQVASIRAQLEGAAPELDLRPFDELPLLYRYLIGFWSRGHAARLDETYSSFLVDRAHWNTRYSNYKHALLYTLKRRRRGIQKYYAGWDTFAYLAGNNIRFFLQLVEQSLLQHLDGGRTLASAVSPDTQTRAAQTAGRTNLSELEGLSVYGMYLSRLVLGLGRVFQVLAEQLEGRAPEMNQFYLVDDSSNEKRRLRAGSDDINVDTLLTEAVMHLALMRFPGTKPTQEGDTEEYDYMLHPIFAPLFAFSYRRKRKFGIGRLQLLALIRSPRPTIQEILSSPRRRPVDFDEDLPDQLALFDAFYKADG
jgi:hypothetical protein